MKQNLYHQWNLAEWKNTLLHLLSPTECCLKWANSELGKVGVSLNVHMKSMRFIELYQNECNSGYSFLQLTIRWVTSCTMQVYFKLKYGVNNQWNLLMWFLVCYILARLHFFKADSDRYKWLCISIDPLTPFKMFKVKIPNQKNVIRNTKQSSQNFFNTLWHRWDGTQKVSRSRQTWNRLICCSRHVSRLWWDIFVDDNILVH